MSPKRHHKQGTQKPSRRRVNSLSVRPRILIVCEGEKTEPVYFNAFRVPTVEIYCVGIGESPLQVVEETIRLMEKAKRSKEPFDQAWSVLDRDDHDINNFSGALDKARRKGIDVAYSNEAFELWYLLHFEYCDTGTSRATYSRRLSRYINKEYKKNSLTTFEDLWLHKDAAINNAERLLNQYDPHNPAVDNPCTTVHLLVKELQRFVK